MGGGCVCVSFFILTWVGSGVGPHKKEGRQGVRLNDHHKLTSPSEGMVHRRGGFSGGLNIAVYRVVHFIVDGERKKGGHSLGREEKDWENTIPGYTFPPPFPNFLLLFLFVLSSKDTAVSWQYSPTIGKDFSVLLRSRRQL